MLFLWAHVLLYKYMEILELQFVCLLIYFIDLETSDNYLETSDSYLETST